MQHSGADFKFMFGNRCQRCPAAPFCRREVNIVVQLAVKFRLVRLRLRQNGFVRIRLAPVRRRRVAGAVGKMNPDGEPPLCQQCRLDMNRNGVQLRIANRFDIHRQAVKLEMAGDYAVPQVQLLLDVRQIIRLRGRAVGVFQDEADLPEMEPVRIFAEPFDLRRLLIVRLVGVRHPPAVQIREFLELEFVNVPAVRIRRRVPAPVRQRAERRRVLKRLREGLQAGRVHREGELAVADGQRIGRVEIRQHHVVPRDERVPVNRRGASSDGAKQDKTVNIKPEGEFCLHDLRTENQRNRAGKQAG